MIVTMFIVQATGETWLNCNIVVLRDFANLPFCQIAILLTVKNHDTACRIFYRYAECHVIVKTTF